MTSSGSFRRLYRNGKTAPGVGKARLAMGYIGRFSIHDSDDMT